MYIKICLRLFTVLFTTSGEAREGGKEGSYESKYPTKREMINYILGYSFYREYYSAGKEYGTINERKDTEKLIINSI